MNFKTENSKLQSDLQSYLHLEFALESLVDKSVSLCCDIINVFKVFKHFRLIRDLNFHDLLFHMCVE